MSSPTRHSFGKVASFQSLKDYLGKKVSRKIGPNTILHQISKNEIAIRLHNTDILVFTPNYVQVYSGGWRTVTTKDRLNRYLPMGISIHQSDFTWFVQTRDGKTAEFDEGLLIPW